MTFSVEQHRDVPNTTQNLPVSTNITSVVRERLPNTWMRGVSNASSLEHRPIENGVGESVVIDEGEASRRAQQHGMQASITHYLLRTSASEGAGIAALAAGKSCLVVISANGTPTRYTMCCLVYRSSTRASLIWTISLLETGKS
jgi:hypothetical protein